MSLTIQNKDQQETLLLPHPKNSFTQNLEFRRWLILISFSFFASTTAMAWITYAPIVDEAQKYYSVTTDAIIEFSNASMYTYFLMSFIVAWMSYKWFNCSLIFCMMANASGAWIRYFAGTSYTIALIGQYIAGTAQNIVLFAPVLIADRWFAAHERDWAVSIATFSGVFGWGFGFMFPAFLVQNGGSGEIAKLLKYEALIASIPLILGIFTLKDKPKMPPSYSASIKETTENNFWKEFCLLVKDKKFLGAAVCFGSLTGLSYTISSVIVLFMPTLSILQQGFIGTTFLSCGIIGGLVGTFLLSRSKKLNYDYALKVFVVMSLVGLVVLALVIKSTKELVNIYILNGILGVGILGFQPFACQILVEMTFPLQETISVNFMMVIAQVFGVVGNFLSSSPLVGDKGLWALVGLTTPCIFYIVFFYKTDAKRTNAEEKHASFVGESLGGESTGINFQNSQKLEN